MGKNAVIAAWPSTTRAQLASLLRADGWTCSEVMRLEYMDMGSLRDKLDLIICFEAVFTSDILQSIYEYQKFFGQAPSPALVIRRDERSVEELMAMGFRDYLPSNFTHEDFM